ncbi:hypothetical protein ACOMHN_051954 [Nucella lapillus]
MKVCSSQDRPCILHEGVQQSGQALYSPCHSSMAQAGRHRARRFHKEPAWRAVPLPTCDRERVPGTRLLLAALLWRVPGPRGADQAAGALGTRHWAPGLG